MVKHYLLALIQWSILFPIEAILDALGLIVVAIALHWRTESPVPDGGKMPYPSRKIVHLPKWAWLWDNFEEGAMSWKSNWPDLCWNKNPDSYLSMWQWLAVRNPTHNLIKLAPWFSAYLPDLTGLKVLAGQDTLSDWSGITGYQFVVAWAGGYPYYGFYCVGKKVSVRIGFKIDPDMYPLPPDLAERKYWRGATFRITPIT